METADYAKSRGIDDEAAFIWWVPHMLRKRNAIVLAIKPRLQKTTQKYSIQIPTSVEHAMEIDQRKQTQLDLHSLAWFHMRVFE